MLLQMLTECPPPPNPTRLHIHYLVPLKKVSVETRNDAILRAAKEKNMENGAVESDHERGSYICVYTTAGQSMVEGMVMTHLEVFKYGCGTLHASRAVHARKGVGQRIPRPARGACIPRSLLEDANIGERLDHTCVVQRIST